MGYKFLFFLLFVFSPYAEAIRGEVLVDQKMNAELSNKVIEIVHLKEKRLETLCSGTIISKGLVLTAAHCFDSEVFDVSLRLKGRVFPVKRVKINSSYKRVDVYDPIWGYLAEVILKNDFALIETSHQFFESNIIKLNEVVSGFTPDLEVYFAGYGQEFNMFGHGTGGGVFRLSYPSPVRASGADEIKVDYGFSGACQGDSGGPALVKPHEDEFIQIGVISTSDCQVRTQAQAISWELIDEASYKVYEVK